MYLWYHEFVASNCGFHVYSSIPQLDCLQLPAMQDNEYPHMSSYMNIQKISLGYTAEVSFLSSTQKACTHAQQGWTFGTKDESMLISMNTYTARLWRGAQT